VNLWIRCDTSSDCPSGSTCTAAQSPEIDSFRDVTNNQLMARWGTSLPDPPGISTSPRVFSNNNGYGFFVTNSHYVTIRGFNIRNTKSPGVAVVPNNGANDHVTISDNRIFYSIDKISLGSDYAIVVNNANDVTITGNTLAYSGSEAIHTQAAYVSGTSCTGSLATRYSITLNWIHNAGDESVVGPDTGDTPWGMILGDCGGGTGNGDYTGSLVQGNIVDRAGLWWRSGRNHVGGIDLENNHSNDIIRDNIVTTVGTMCFGLRAWPTSTGVNSNQIFNNVAWKCGQDANAAAGDGAGIRVDTGGGTASNNKFYNNTLADCIPTPGDFACLDFGGGGTATGNEFRNNIFQMNTSEQVIRWSATGEFDNNIVKSTAGGTIAAFGGTSVTCATIGTLQTSNVCADPLFANTASNDYHIQTTSPAKDAGKSTGMPAGRTTDINNTIASLHGFPSYADNQAQAGAEWDVGADEFSSGSSPNMTISKTDSPDPVVAGNNITYTLSYANTGGASATNVVISDTVPTNTTFVSATAGGAFGGGITTWNLGTVISGGSGTVQMVVQVASPLANGTVISNAYSITCTEQGSVVGTLDTTTVTSLPFLILGKSDAPDPVLAGSNITYTLAYSNTGTAGATGVVITDTVPVNTTFVSATGGGTLGGGVVTWTIGAVNAGASSTVQMVVTVGAGMASGSTITNQTYALASNELATVKGSPVTTSVTTASQSVAQYVLPITQRQNTWSATQTDVFGPQADVVQGPNTSQWIRGQATELLTLSTSGTTTDTSANLLPADAIIDAVVARVVVTIGTATNWKLGDATQAGRFTAVQTGLTAGTTVVGLLHADPTVATANLGPVQTAAAKVRVTTSGTPSSGQIRITVFYRQFVPPGS